MDNSSLESIFSEQVTTETPAPEVTQPETVAEPVVQEQEQTTGEEAGTPPEPQKEDPLEKHRKGLEAAAAAERKKRQDAEARAEAAERRAQALEQQYRQPPQQPKQEATDKPLREQFASEDDWLDARDQWRDQQRERQAKEAKELEQAKTMYEKTEGIYAKAQALEGFDRAAFDRLPLTQPIVRALIESDHAPELMRFMSSNPDEVGRIAGLSDTRQIAELARIEDKLNAAPPAPPKEEKPRPQLPETLTQARDARGRFEPAYDGPTPLNAILATK